MKNSKKAISAGISMLLLLVFSVTILPLDFLHTHSVTEQVCSDKNIPCSHKVHVAKKATYCWACAFHTDKSFINSDTRETTVVLPVVKLLFDNAVTGYVTEILYTALRGPPSE